MMYNAVVNGAMSPSSRTIMAGFFSILYKCFKCGILRLRIVGDSVVVRCLFFLNSVRVGHHLSAIGVPSINVSRGGRADIGDCFTIRTGVGCTEVGSGGSRIRVGPRGVLRIGNGVGMSNATIVCDESVTIGDHVLIGGGAQLFDTNFHSTDAAVRCSGRESRKDVATAPVLIGNRVFIGSNVLICKGVTIGDEAMVAAGAVVVHDIPPGEVWGGNPAKRLR